MAQLIASGRWTKDGALTAARDRGIRFEKSDPRTFFDKKRWTN